MSFKILLLAPDVDPSWPEKIRRAVPGVVVKAFADPKDAVEDIVDADATYGTVPPELLARATKLRWICADRAGLGGTWFYDELVKGDVIVTNMRGSYNEHLAGHAVAFLLAFARRFDHYLPQKQWRRGPEMIDLPQKTVLIVGVGGAGGEASGLCAALGMRVLGIDPRVTRPPVGMADLTTPERLEERLGQPIL
jgi:phosphoglycerate dehydrogenase-like enzyme